MTNAGKRRVIDLQASLKIARTALEKIKNGCRDPEGTADDALDRMFPLERRQPLQGLCGHERRRA